MEWLSVFLLSGILCMFAQGWTITDIQVTPCSAHTAPQPTPTCSSS